MVARSRLEVECLERQTIALERIADNLERMVLATERANHLTVREQLIQSLNTYMKGSERVRAVIQTDYEDFVKVCDKCYSEILNEAIKTYHVE